MKGAMSINILFLQVDFDLFQHHLLKALSLHPCSFVKIEYIHVSLFQGSLLFLRDYSDNSISNKQSYKQVLL